MFLLLVIPVSQPPPPKLYHFNGITILTALPEYPPLPVSRFSYSIILNIRSGFGLTNLNCFRSGFHAGGRYREIGVFVICRREFELNGMSGIFGLTN